MPIQRNEFLAPLSREHHHGLLLCWKIRTGFRKGVDIGRIQSYADWFFRNHLLVHFEVEERFVFSILGNDNKLVRRAMMEHRKLRRLFESREERSLGLIEEKLETHIRFEERVLFNEIQSVASREEFREIMEKHADHSALQNAEEWKDEFWK
jgi:hypothetical protein